METTKKLEDLKKSKEKESANFVQFEEASRRLNELVELGLTKKRGYNLLTSEEIYSPITTCQYKDTQ